MIYTLDKTDCTKVKFSPLDIEALLYPFKFFTNLLHHWIPILIDPLAAILCLSICKLWLSKRTLVPQGWGRIHPNRGRTTPISILELSGPKGKDAVKFQGSTVDRGAHNIFLLSFFFQSIICCCIDGLVGSTQLVEWILFMHFFCLFCF